MPRDVVWSEPMMSRTEALPRVLLRTNPFVNSCLSYFTAHSTSDCRALARGGSVLDWRRTGVDFAQHIIKMLLLINLITLKAALSAASLRIRAENELAAMWHCS